MNDPPPDPRDVDVQAVVKAWGLGQHVWFARHVNPSDTELAEAGARKVLDTLLERGWQRPGAVDVVMRSTVESVGDTVALVLAHYDVDDDARTQLLDVVDRTTAALKKEE